MTHPQTDRIRDRATMTRTDDVARLRTHRQAPTPQAQPSVDASVARRRARTHRARRDVHRRRPPPRPATGLTTTAGASSPPTASRPTMSGPSGSPPATGPRSGTGTARTWATSRHPVSASSVGVRRGRRRTTDDAWAVGSQDPDGTGVRVAYAQHWDGSQVASGRRRSRPLHVRGQRRRCASGGRRLDRRRRAEERCGCAHRARRALGRRPTGAMVPTAKIDPGCDAVLSDVAAVAADDVWAAGTLNCDGSSTALVEHWDGKRWSRVDVPSPARASYAGLDGITAIAPDDIWAVGFSSRGRGSGQHHDPPLGRQSLVSRAVAEPRGRVLRPRPEPA